MPELNTWNAKQGGDVTNVVTGGFANFNDTLTPGTPITVPGTETYVPLTNNALGVFTTLNLPAGVTNIYDALTGLFNFSELSMSDMVDIRIDILVTTLMPNTTINVDIQLGQGSGGEITIPWVFQTFKTAKTHVVNRSNWFYIGTTDTRVNPAQFRIFADNACTVVVRSWAVRILRVGS